MKKVVSLILALFILILVTIVKIPNDLMHLFYCICLIINVILLFKYDYERTESSINDDFNKVKLCFNDLIIVLISSNIIYSLFSILKQIPSINISFQLLFAFVSLIVSIFMFIVLKKYYVDDERSVRLFLDLGFSCFLLFFVLLISINNNYDAKTLVPVIALALFYPGVYYSFRAQNEYWSFFSLTFFIPALLLYFIPFNIEFTEKIKIMLSSVLFILNLPLIIYRINNFNKEEDTMTLLAPILLLSFELYYYLLRSDVNGVMSFYLGILFVIMVVVLIVYNANKVDYYKSSLNIWIYSLLLSIIFTIGIYLIIKYIPHVFVNLRELSNFIMNDNSRLLSVSNTLITLCFLVFYPIIAIILNRFGIPRN